MSWPVIKTYIYSDCTPPPPPPHTHTHTHTDPIPILDQAIAQQQKLMQSQDHEIEIKQLRETLHEYNSEFAHVKNQEVTIQKLREQLKDMEDKIEATTAVSGCGLQGER